MLVNRHSISRLPADVSSTSSRLTSCLRSIDPVESRSNCKSIANIQIDKRTDGRVVCSSNKAVKQRRRLGFQEKKIELARFELNLLILLEIYLE